MNPNNTGIRPGGEIFTVAFAALVATSFCFVLRALTIDAWGHEFDLSETQKGELLGVGLWPFAISIVLLSLFIDRIGFRAVLWLAAACHLGGIVCLLLADGYWSLYVGTFILALGNGAVEAAINPLIATAYRNDKTRWLNRLHAGWPGGTILGGLFAIGLGTGTDWRIKIALIAIPVLIYIMLLTRTRFPVSERVAAGISYREMLSEAGAISALVILSLMAVELGRVLGLSGTTIVLLILAPAIAFAAFTRSLGRPLFVLMLLLMIPLAITELSTDSWITALMEPEALRLGIQPGWILVYTASIMFIMRLYAGTLSHKLSPLGVLACGSAITAVGLYALSSATGMMLLAAATLYGIGKSFFWGTSLGVVAEQFPKGGAITLNVVAASGMLAAGILGSALLGNMQDRSNSRALQQHDEAQHTELSARYLGAEKDSVFGLYRALDAAHVETAPAADKALLVQIAEAGKKAALREVAVLPLLTMFVYLLLLLYFRRKGGYRTVMIGNGEQP
jgi:DHA2 family metal-tetracycline-proton antiporter-like MFS transporter